LFDYRFEDQAALQLLGLIPILFLLVWWTARRTQSVIRSRISQNNSGYLLRSVSTRRRKIKLWLQCLTMFFFVIALARPQSGESKQKAKSEGLEIMLAVDVSNSMMAEDVRPSRMELARRELSRFVDMLSGDKVGIVAFAGSAILLSPMTNDKGALKMFLESIGPDAVRTQGTDFKKALNESYTALQRGGLDSDESKQITKVIVIASDGEDNEKGALDMARKISSEGVRIFTLGFGTEQGGQIPLRDKEGNMIGYRKDRGGQAIVTKSTGQALQALAEAGKGTYQQVTFGGDAMKLLKQNIDNLQRVQMDSMEITHYDEHYQLFLAIGIILAMIEMFLGDRRTEGRLWRGRFEVPQS
jgi:Ca-activated chloride channel family protein